MCFPEFIILSFYSCSIDFVYKIATTTPVLNIIYFQTYNENVLDAA